ncbi:MAG: 50S ribosomal protein L21 [Pseudomonadota bacterium]
MYAVFASGGKQHRVSEGDLVRLEQLEGDVGNKVVFEQVLMTGGEGEPKIGQPVVAGAQVQGEIARHGRGKKILVYKRKCKGFHKQMGHRQPFTEVKITGIKG